MPVDLHAVPQLHPQLGLLLGGHTLPALLDASEGRVGDGMLGGGADLLGSDGLLLELRASIQASHWARDGAVGANGRRGHGRAASGSPGDRASEHCAKGGHSTKDDQLNDKNTLSGSERERILRGEGV